MISPDYYDNKSMSCKDIIRHMCNTLIGEDAYYMGCIIKYLYRYENKNKDVDLDKALTYMTYLPTICYPITTKGAEMNYSNICEKLMDVMSENLNGRDKGKMKYIIKYLYTYGHFDDHGVAWKNAWDNLEELMKGRS